MDRHLPTVAAYVRRRVADRADAEEIVADVFIRAWRNQQSRPDEVDAERAWLLTIARHRVIDQYRRDDARDRMRERLMTGRPRLVEDAPDLPADPALEVALSMLRSDDRELLRLVAWEQLPHSEIAVVLGCTTANVAVRLHRARGRLREVLDRLEAADVETAPCLSTENDGNRA